MSYCQTRHNLQGSNFGQLLLLLGAYRDPEFEHVPYVLLGNPNQNVYVKPIQKENIRTFAMRKKLQTTGQNFACCNTHRALCPTS